MKRIILAIVILLTLSPTLVRAQEQTEAPAAPQTLFPYPQVPDTISSLENRTNFIVSKFWDNYDVSKPITNPEGFENAFADYIDFFKYAHKTVVMTSIRDFVNKLQSNTTNLLVVAKLADKYLYGPTASYWSDEVYVPFIQGVLSSKKLKNTDKEYFKNQLSKINGNQEGQIAPDIEVTTVDGNKQKLSSLVNGLTFIFFTEEDCDGCVISRLRLSTDVNINTLIKDGKLKIVCVTPNGYSKEWAEKVKGWADNWTIAASNETNSFDLRIKPTIFVVDKDYKILNKNMTVEGILNMFIR